MKNVTKNKMMKFQNKNQEKCSFQDFSSFIIIYSKMVNFQM